MCVPGLTSPPAPMSSQNVHIGHTLQLAVSGRRSWSKGKREPMTAAQHRTRRHRPEREPRAGKPIPCAFVYHLCLPNSHREHIQLLVNGGEDDMAVGKLRVGERLCGDTHDSYGTSATLGLPPASCTRWAQFPFLHIFDRVIGPT